MKKFTSFYTYPNFTLDDTAVAHHSKSLDRDAEKLRQVIYEHQSTNGWMLRISTDGLIQFSDDKLEEEIDKVNESVRNLFDPKLVGYKHVKSFDSSWSKYLDICNAIHLCLECCMHTDKLSVPVFEFQTMSYGDTARVTYDSNNVPIRQVSYRNDGVNVLMRHGDYLPDKIKKLVIPKSVIECLCNYYLESILQNDLTLQLAVKVGQSLSDYNTGNWSSSVVTSWFVTEWYLGKLWDEFVLSKSIPKDRLTRMANYTTSIKIEHLQLHKIIDDSKCETINKLRKKRNKIAHEFINTNATKEDSIEGLDLCKWVLFETTGLEFTFSVQGFAIHGL